MEKEIRKLARSSYYQNLYSTSKECFGIQLFKNVSMLSGLQNQFLYWLNIYSMLYEELFKKEDDLLTENVIIDDDRCDAYLIHRRNKHEQFWKQRQLDEKIDASRRKHPTKHKSGNTAFIPVDLRRED